jgi:hypothetical protein
MNKKPVLVDLKKLRELVSKLDLGDPKWNEYIDARWLNYVEWWDSRASNDWGALPVVAERSGNCWSTYPRARDDSPR